MADNQSPATKNRPAQKVLAFCYLRRFTILENFALKVLEKQGGTSDEEIARILCLDAGDIPIILKEFTDRMEVQGDHSRRTLGDSFSRQEVVFCAASSTPTPQEAINCTSEITTFLARCGNPPAARLSKKQEEWKREKGVKDIYALSIFSENMKDDFQCNGESVPKAIHSALSEIFHKKAKQKQ